MDAPDQNIKFIFGENSIYYLRGNAYLQFDKTLRKDDKTTFNDEAIRLTNNAFVYTFKETRLATTGGSDREHKKYVGQLSTNMKLLTSKYEDSLTYFGKFNGN